MPHQIHTFSEDQIRDEDKPYWKVTLSDGNQYIQHDILSGRVAWLDLKEYCETNGVCVRDMYIVFRCHTEHVYSSVGSDGVFFRKMSLGSFGDRRTAQFYLIGSVSNGRISVDHWRVPELLKEDFDTREANEHENWSVIWNLNQDSME